LWLKKAFKHKGKHKVAKRKNNLSPDFETASSAYCLREEGKFHKNKYICIVITVTSQG